MISFEFRFAKLTSDSVIECLLGKVASLIRGVQNLIIEDREVEGETKTDWVGWSKVSLGNFGCVLVSLEGLVGRLLSLITNGELSKVTVVISLPVVKCQKFNKLKRKGSQTSCGRKPWTLRSWQKESSACQGPWGYLHRCRQAQPQFFGGTPW